MKQLKWAKEIHAWADGADIEVSWIGNEDIWVDVNDPKWSNCDYLYRIKPKIITRTISYPKPLTSFPHEGHYWVVGSSTNHPILIKYPNQYINSLINGMCFATEEDAQACHEALFGKHV